MLLTTLGSESFLFQVYSLDIGLLESCDSTKSLSGTDVTLSPSDATLVVKCVLYHGFVVHGEARTSALVGRVEARIQSVVILQRVATSSLLTVGSSVEARHGSLSSDACAGHWSDLVRRVELNGLWVLARDCRTDFI